MTYDEPFPWKEQFLYYYMTPNKEVVFLLLDKEQASSKGWLFFPETYAMLRGSKLTDQERMACSIQHSPCVDNLPCGLVMEASYDVVLPKQMAEFMWNVVEFQEAGNRQAVVQLTYQNRRWLTNSLQRLVDECRQTGLDSVQNLKNSP